MKKFFKTTLAFVATVSLLSLGGCQKASKEDINPTYDGEAVKTQFTISFPQNVAKSKMTADAVQNTATIAKFRGMDNIVLYPFAKTGLVGENPITSSDLKLGNSAISLYSMLKPTTGTVNNSIPASTLVENSNAVLFNDVTIPVGTGSFLFYGKAIDNGSEKFVNGALGLTGDEPSAIEFTPVQTNASSTVSAVGTELATYLSSIAQATGWSDITNPASNLKLLFDNFITLKAGSSKDVQAAVQDLYTSVKGAGDAVSTAIVNAITNATYATDDGAGTLVFTAAVGNTEDTYFPGDVNLPDGAALLDYDPATKTFTQKTDGAGNTGSNITASYSDYVYPASLYYYANSGVKTSNTSKSDAYDGVKDWDDIYSLYTDGTSISYSTRSVAILDAIQYAVGRLDAYVKTANNTLYDKKGEAYDATAGFTVTGILIGGQKSVGFDFTPKGSTPYTIYDNVSKSQSGETLKATTSASDPVYTLALETAANTHIYVAVELQNDGADFQGYDGLVPSGCKFYLVAELNPESDGSGVSGVSNTGNKVFKQDYKTIANFTIAQGTEGVLTNTKGLAAAYNTIPDLRTPQLELGLSVNLEWQAGITFNLDL